MSWFISTCPDVKTAGSSRSKRPEEGRQCAAREYLMFFQHASLAKKWKCHAGLWNFEDIGYDILHSVVGRHFGYMPAQVGVFSNVTAASPIFSSAKTIN